MTALARSPLAKPLPELLPVAGVRLGTAQAGVRYPGRYDLTMAEFAPGTTVAGIFTRNKCAGAPVDWCRAALSHGTARALVVNTGNANVFTGRAGVDATQATAAAAARLVHCAATEIFIASTGVIGEILPHDRITNALPALHASLADHAWASAAEAIGTTDTFPKGAFADTSIDGQPVRIQGIAKGSGMIAPDMATMLGFIVTDAALPQSVLQALLSATTEHSFNKITVDSDTSTSDMVLAFATGQVGHDAVTDAADARLKPFADAFATVMHELALLVIRDGEGATKLIHVTVAGAVSDASAKKVALSIGNSPLVKTAIAGGDANWGRVVMAVGKAGEPANRDTLSVAIGGVWIARHGMVAAHYDEAPVVEHMKGETIEIQVDLGLGNGRSDIWSCDLTHGYIDINGSYRS